MLVRGDIGLISGRYQMDSIRNGRARSIDKALAAFNATLPRRGRLIRQLSRCFLVYSRPTPKQMREYCYPGRKRQHWHHTNIYRALRNIRAT